MTTRFFNVDGEEIVCTISGYREGTELRAVTESPLVFEIKPIGGQTPYFPSVMTLACTLVVESPSVFYHSDLLTNSYTLTVTKGGTTVFVGSTLRFGNSEPLKYAPYPFKIEALEAKATWAKEQYTDWQTSCLDTVSMTGILSGVPSNEFWDMDQIDTRKRFLAGQTKQTIANWLNASFLCTIGGPDGFEKLWIHNYLSYDASGRNLTANARNTPRISWDAVLGRLQVTLNSSPDKLKVVDEEEDNVTDTTYNYPACAGYSFLEDGVSGGVQVSPQTGFELSCKFINITFSIATNSAYDAALAGGSVTNTRQDDYTLSIQVKVENTFDATVRYFKFSDSTWSASSSEKLSLSDDVENYSLTFRRNITKHTLSDFGSPGTFTPQTTLIVEVSGLSGSFEYSTDGGSSWLNGGTITYSIESIKTDLDFSLANQTTQFDLVSNSDEDSQVIPYQVYFDNFIQSSFTSVAATNYLSFISPKIGSYAFAVTSDISDTNDSISKYSKKTLQWLQTYLGAVIGRVSLDMKADNDMYIAPYKPFEFDYGLGNKLFKILRGKLDAKANLFKGQIHEINIS